MLLDAEVGRVLGDRQRVIAALTSAHEAARSVVDEHSVALCEGRVGELLGAGPAATQPQTEDDHALVAFVDQWVRDVASISDELVAPLRSRLGDDGLQDLIHALLVVEQRARLRLAWTRLGLLP